MHLAMSSINRREDGGAIVEFAMALPIFVLFAVTLVSALSLAADRVRMQGVASTAARVIARGDSLSSELQAELDAVGDMHVTMHSQYLIVDVERTHSLLRHEIQLRARAVARTEVSTNDFEQN
jgi:Flp pilus assembly protein TadG